MTHVHMPENTTHIKKHLPSTSIPRSLAHSRAETRGLSPFPHGFPSRGWRFRNLGRNDLRLRQGSERPPLWIRDTLRLQTALQSMLDREWDQLLRQLLASCGASIKFFSFVDTVSARNHAGTNRSSIKAFVGIARTRWANAAKDGSVKSRSLKKG